MTAQHSDQPLAPDFSRRTDRISWVTGLTETEISTYEDGPSMPSMDLRLCLATQLDPATSAILTQHLVTYARFATLLKQERDWAFAIRILRQSVLKASRIVASDDIDAFHCEPPLSGYVGWDSLLAGVALMSGRDRVSNPAILDWVSSPARRVTGTLFDPLDSGKYVWLEAMRTPVEIRERNVILSRGNLEGV